MSTGHLRTSLGGFGLGLVNIALESDPSSQRACAGVACSMGMAGSAARHAGGMLGAGGR